MVDKKPLCGSCVDGWIEDPETLLPVRRCPCRYRDISPDEARENGVAATVQANPQAMKAALAIIRDAAKTNPILSSNTVRTAMAIARIPGPVRGAAWRQACIDNVVRPAGTEPSTQPETHAHHVRIYESLRFHRGDVA